VFGKECVVGIEEWREGYVNDMVNVIIGEYYGTYLIDSSHDPQMSYWNGDQSPCELNFSRVSAAGTKLSLLDLCPYPNDGVPAHFVTFSSS
jgi:hypothetical protein